MTHTDTRTSTHAHTHAYVYAYAYAHTHKHTRTHTHARTHLPYISLCIYRYQLKQPSWDATHAYTTAHECTSTCIHAHDGTHAYTCKRHVDASVLLERSWVSDDHLRGWVSTDPCNFKLNQIRMFCLILWLFNTFCKL